jgi:hypothetical protein
VVCADCFWLLSRAYGWAPPRAVSISISRRTRRRTERTAGLSSDPPNIGQLAASGQLSAGRLVV